MLFSPPTPEQSAMVRQFLATPAGQAWILYSMHSCKVPEPTNVTPECYNVCLIHERGWRSGLTFAQACVQQVVYPDYDLAKPIDNSQE
jgi:hypothetical protein